VGEASFPEHTFISNLGFSVLVPLDPPGEPSLVMLGTRRDFEAYGDRSFFRSSFFSLRRVEIEVRVSARHD